MLKPCADALNTAGLTVEQVSSVEMVGGASRTPAIVRKVAEFFQQEPKRCANLLHSGTWWVGEYLGCRLFNAGVLFSYNNIYAEP